MTPAGEGTSAVVHADPFAPAATAPPRHGIGYPADEVEFLIGHDLGRWPSRDTFDIVLVDDAGRVLMIELGKPPYAGHAALPGGFVDPGERPVDAALRELAKETELAGVGADSLIYVGNTPGGDRDPRGPVSTTYFAAKVPAEMLDKAVGSDDARHARPVPARDLVGMDLAFDHRHILAQALAEPDLGVSWQVSDGLLAGVPDDVRRNRAFAAAVRARRAVELKRELDGCVVGDVAVINGREVGASRVMAGADGKPVLYEMRWDPTMTGEHGAPVRFYIDRRQVAQVPAPRPEVDRIGYLAAKYVTREPGR